MIIRILSYLSRREYELTLISFFHDRNHKSARKFKGELIGSCMHQMHGLGMADGLGSLTAFHSKLNTETMRFGVKVEPAEN